MNQQERDCLLPFLTKLSEARVSDKNAEADALIREAVAKQPDAAYLLVQRTLLMEQALEAVKAKNVQLENELQRLLAASAHGAEQASFLGRGNPWAVNTPSPAAQPPASVPGIGTYQAPHPAAPMGNPAAGGAPSFLGSVAATAAGVAAGSFLFQGIENLLGHHGMGSQWPGGGAPGAISEQTVVNNNYFISDPDDSATASDNSTFLASDSDDEFMGDSDDSTWI